MNVLLVQRSAHSLGSYYKERPLGCRASALICLQPIFACSRRRLESTSQ